MDQLARSQTKTEEMHEAKEQALLIERMKLKEREEICDGLGKKVSQRKNECQEKCLDLDEKLLELQEQTELSSSEARLAGIAGMLF